MFHKMANKNEVLGKTLYFFILILTLISFCESGHGSRIGQAGALTALRRTKIRAQVYVTDEKWLLQSNLVHTPSIIVGKMEDDLIEGGLPGQPSLAGPMFKQYAGYVSVDESHGRSLLYYFAEAAHNPSSKPLILWLNGGPGCSSLGVGALMELGPFGVNPDGQTLYARQFSWNKVANILFLESPAGVGFSYSNTTSDYGKSGDKRTAEDTYIYLVNWFKRFPHYRARDFYIMGESYAGFYIPELADVIINGNKEADTTAIIQLKGIMIGNGIMNEATDSKGTFDFYWSHALISDETYKGLLKHCMVNGSSPDCQAFQHRVDVEAGNIDFSNIYGPICSPSSLSKNKKRHGGGGYDPCQGEFTYRYLNLPRVQQALHANITKLPYRWAICSDFITPTNWTDSPSSMLPIYRRLIASGLRILLYSGDADGVVPVLATRYSIDSLKLRVLKPWHPWFDDTKEVGGYRVVYNGLTFATVRDAGHEVPMFQPRRAFAMLKHFIANAY